MKRVSFAAIIFLTLSPVPLACLADDASSSQEYKDSIRRGTALPTSYVHIDAAKTFYSKDGDWLTATGNVTVTISGQKSKLTANRVQYHLTDSIMDALGDVEIFRYEAVSKGERFRFWIGSPDYLVTNEANLIDIDKKPIRRPSLTRSKRMTRDPFRKAPVDSSARIDAFLHGDEPSLEGDFGGRHRHQN